MPSTQPLLLLFVDGVGLAPATSDNPFARVPTPGFELALGGPLAEESIRREPATGPGGGSPSLLIPLDAQLGVPGKPQSATGQTALLTGVNAPAALERHVTAFPGPRLREILEEHSVLKRAAAAGHRVTFANPFTPGYFDSVAAGQRRPSATTVAARAAGLALRTLDDLEGDRAVAWDMERDFFAARLETPLEPITARAAGGHLAALAGDHDLTLYETFYTDLAGHGRWKITPEDAVRRLDGLFHGVLEGLLERRPPELTVLLTSDHGNLEDTSHTHHTENPVPLLAVGPAAGRFADLTRLDQVAGRMLEVLGRPG